MALIKSTFTPGIDKQTSTYGAEGKWVDSKNVRFRTGLPEKMGGWEKVVAQLRAVHPFLVEIADQALPVRRHVGA